MPIVPQFPITPIVYIYALVDPETNAIRYVGKTNTPILRFRQHMTPRLLCKKSHKNSWIIGLKARSLKPVLRILQCAPEFLWAQLECEWISRLTAQGCDLVNLTPGGDGPPCSEKTKAILRAINLGKKRGPHSEETRRKISMAHTGRKLSPERIEKTAAKLRGRPNWAKGIPKTAETKDKLSRDWWLIDPRGQVVFVRNLKQFCKDNNLQDSLMNYVATGKRKSHKGWSCKRADE